MLSRIFQQSDVPPEYRSNFIHLYMDIAWFGVLSGSAINFINVYAARLGATGLQIGLLGAVSAIINLLIAIPSGRWIEQRHTGRAVFGASVYYRIGYLLWIFLPWLFTPEQQIRVLILLALLMAIPLAPLSVGFNALFASAVPAEYRAHVAGFRNITFAIAYMLTSLLSGYLLKQIAFPSGYQIVFAIGFLGAAMSSLHLYFIKPLPEESSPPPPAPAPDSVKPSGPRRELAASLRLDIWHTPYRKVLLALFGFHLAQYLALPLFPLYNVNVLLLNDNNIGIGTAIFYLTVLIGSTQLRQIVGKLSHKGVTGWGVIGMAVYPLALAFSHQVWQYYLISFWGGFTWAMVGGAYANYMLENIPAHDRPTHLAWYNIVLNAAILIGSLGGPAISNQIGLSNGLILAAALRFLAGWAILRWG
jgi:MFS family permease